MAAHFARIAYRHAKTNPVFAIGSLLSLVLGFCSALIIMSYVHTENGMDSFHKNPKQIHQLFTHPEYRNNSCTQVELGPEILRTVPGVEAFTRYHWPWGETVVSRGEMIQSEKHIRFVDPTFFEVFHFPLISGDPETALTHPDSIVITPDVARKYFGDKNPLGQQLIFNRQKALTVTGILSPVPANSTIKFDMLMPIDFNIAWQDPSYLDWRNQNVYTFIRLHPGVPPQSLIHPIGEILRKRGGIERPTVTLLPLDERYFTFYANATTVDIFLFIALFILLIASFNCTNLALARAGRRAREIGLRKVMGAKRSKLTLQILGESFLLSLLAALISIGLYGLLHPWLGTISGRDIPFNLGYSISLSIIMTLITTLSAGLYPALFLSRLRIIQIIRGIANSGTKKGALRKGIVVIQFILSTLLILGMLTVRRQTNYILHNPVGYDMDNLISIPMGGGSETKYPALRRELLKHPQIQGVSGSGVAFPLFNWRQGGYSWEGISEEDSIQVSYNRVDYHIVSTLKMTLLEGQDFDEGRSEPNQIIINEKLARLMSPGPVCDHILTQGNRSMRIVGVVKDFHFNSLENRIEPLVLELSTEGIDNMLVRIKNDTLPGTLEDIQRIWKQVIPQYPFRTTFFTDAYQESAIGIRGTGTLVSAFSILAILISCLGLYGLTDYTIARRQKELGIRKVLGAGFWKIFYQLSSETLKLVLLANILVWPLAYYILNLWLAGFAYHGPLSLDLFFCAGIFSLVISQLVISQHMFRAARTRPVDTLRCE